MANRRTEHCSRLRREAGFTVVELLVTISIVSLLVAITSPAIQSARESARRIECKSNLKQLGMACIGHHDVHGHFPTGGWGWCWVGDADRGFGKNQPGGWVFNLLPYVEEYPLYDGTTDGDPNLMTRKQRRGAKLIVETPLKIINCPSRRPNVPYPLTSSFSGNDGFFNAVTPSVAGRSDYAINSGHIYNEWGKNIFGRGPRGYDEADSWTINKFWGGDQPAFINKVPGSFAMTGISYERSEVAIRQITDGLSNTYLVGEKFVPYREYLTGGNLGDNETWCTGFNNDNYRKSSRFVDEEILEARPIPDTDLISAEGEARFGSAHPTVWNVVLCDGSVKEMSYSIDWQVHRDLGNRLDGNMTESASESLSSL